VRLKKRGTTQKSGLMPPHLMAKILMMANIYLIFSLISLLII